LPAEGEPAESPAGSQPVRSAYKRFWDDVGENFPDLAGALSTRQYRESEERLFRRYLAPLDGCRIFKTDLWDEAKNTRILRWSVGEGGIAFGADLSVPIVRRARAEFGDRILRGVVADVRWLPFRDGAFDAVYSMGTVEHFDETDQALAEIYRVVAAGGRAVIGVPNRHDPFLRPLLVALLDTLGLYGYGFEKSYSRRAFRAMLERTGFEIVGESGLLFIPGWLRMLELACNRWLPFLRPIVAVFVWPFAALERRFPWFGRHGYLLATAVAKRRRPTPVE